MPNQTKVSPEVIEQFLNGSNPMKYVVAIDVSYNEPYAYLTINDPKTGKRIEKHRYKPFLWYKHEVKSLVYGGKRDVAAKQADYYTVKTKKLTTNNADGYAPERLENGYKYMATCSKSYNDLVMFFRNGGLDIFDKEISKNFLMFTPAEQFMIQTGIRLFKGIDDYNDLHRLQFDLETMGLHADRHAIFQIGMKDNRGFEEVVETTGTTPQQHRDSERANIKKLFEVINRLKPDVISGYNSEGFDWPFILERCARLNINYENFAVGLDGYSVLKRRKATLKLGNETESYEQTHMFGYNFIDIAHSVRRAMAINSDIKKWNLKYITQYSEIAKKNRVYVRGDNIYKIWADVNSRYAFNNKNGDWYKISERMELKDGYKNVTGSYIINRYLLDDLWETEQIDNIFNQAVFLIAKMVPTIYCRTATMGTAGQWKLIMAAWSFENNLAIPELEKKREFTGGLSRLLRVGYSKNGVKLDYAALYPKTQLTNNIFPDLDITHVMEGILAYIVDTRDESKFLAGKYNKQAKALTKELKDNKSNYSEEKLQELKEELNKIKSLANLHDKKQLPLKILANSWFGAYGAPYIFNWGETDCAESTTCHGRQYLRLMVKHFVEKYGFKPLLGDTDGFNFEVPDNINEIKYVAKGSHWKTTEDAGKELVGLEAVLAEFNENHLEGRMGLDIDYTYDSTINFSRKNYAINIEGKIKFTGNSIKSKKMPVYIEEFLDEGIKLLLNDKGKEFIDYYYAQVDKINNYGIPLVKIASKSKIKQSLSDYKVRIKKKNKAGNPMPKQAHMELAILNSVDVNLGDTIYYVNIGTSKTDGDLKTLKDGTLKLNCKLIDPAIIESNLEMIKEIESLRKMLDGKTPEDGEIIKKNIADIENGLMTDEYNTGKYLIALNNKVKPLLVCFHPDIRHKILIDIKKDRKTKLEKLTDRYVFTESECKLVSGMPEDPSKQDSYEELMTMEDKEIKFWDKVNKVPKNMTAEVWEPIKADYFERKRIEKRDGIAFEKEKLDGIFKRLEYDELIRLRSGEIPLSIQMLAITDTESATYISRKWGVSLAHIHDTLRYEEEITAREKWCTSSGITFDKYDNWLHYMQDNNLVYEPKEKEIIINAKDDLPEEIIEIPDTVEIENEEDEEDKEFDDVDDFGVELQKLEFTSINAGTQQIPTQIQEPEPDIKMNFIKKFIATAKTEQDEWNF